MAASIGCAAPIADESPDGEDISATSVDSALCEQASTHLRQCFSVGVPTEAATCDARAARWTLERGCDQLAIELGLPMDGEPVQTRGLSNAARTWLSDLACSLGFEQYCDVPRCAPAESFGATTCEELAAIDGCGACYYYTCREEELGLSCGGQGYFEGYGEKYCQIFSDWTVPRLSPPGKAWIDDVRACLIDFAGQGLDANMTCGEVKDAAFASHPDCYVGTGFCALPPSDWAAVLATIAPWDNDLRQALATGVGCLASW